MFFSFSLSLYFYLFECCWHTFHQVGTHAKDIQEAQGMIIPILMPLMLFSGFFLPYDEIPVFFRWLYEISFLRYAFNVLKMNQWRDVTFSDCAAGDDALCQVRSGCSCPFSTPHSRSFGLPLFLVGSPRPPLPPLYLS
jgi:hypothetical protein